MTLPHGTPLWWYTRHLFVGGFGNSEMEPSKSDNSSTKVWPSNFRPPTTGWTVWKFWTSMLGISKPLQGRPPFCKPAGHKFNVSLCKVEHRFLRCALLHKEVTHFENEPVQIYCSVCTKMTFEVIFVRKSQAKPPDWVNNPTGGWTRTVYSFDRGICYSGA